jgi:phosphoglycerate dehydrogenase-like enzyme
VPVAIGPPTARRAEGHGSQWASEAVGDSLAGVPRWAADAVAAGGGIPVGLGEPAEALVWLSTDANDQLADALRANPGLRWVQLPFAGIEAVAATGIVTGERVWTCAKGSYAEPVAEHALALAQAGLRLIPERVRATSWGRSGGTSLYDQKVTILGGGGITQSLLGLLAPYRVSATVVRRTPTPVTGAARTTATVDLHEALEGALVVFLALALTPETVGIVGEAELARMDRRAWLINVARGRHVDTDALAAALRDGEIAGAGLDVTDPEPLPDGHPLWSLPNCIVTPHTADTWEMVRPKLAERITTNVARFVAGEPLVGLVDPDAGY